MSSPRLCNPVCFGVDPHRDWPVALGRKGPSWFLVFTQPRGMRLKREHIVLNTLMCDDPVPPPCDEGHHRFAYFCPLEPSTLSSLLCVRIQNGPNAGFPLVIKTGREIDGFVGPVPEIEVQLDESELLHACANCETWETPGRPTFRRCGTCKARFYCSEQCHKLHWRSRHRHACKLIVAGDVDGAEAFEGLHVEGMEWQMREIMDAGPFCERHAHVPGLFDFFEGNRELGPDHSESEDSDIESLDNVSSGDDPRLPVNKPSVDDPDNRESRFCTIM